MPSNTRQSSDLSPHDTPDSRRNRANDPLNDSLNALRNPTQRRYLCPKCQLPPHGAPPNCRCPGGSSEDDEEDDDLMNQDSDDDLRSRGNSARSNAGKRRRRK